MNSHEQSDRKSISGESVTTVFTEDLDFGGIANNLPLEKKITVSSLEPYSVFPRSQKLLIVVIAALTGIVSPLSANIYFPALNAIKEVKFIY